MVTGFNHVRRELGDALREFQPNLNVFHYVPRTLNPPAAIIQPQPQQTINYLEAQASRSAKWNFNVLIVIGLVNERAAQDRAGDLISPGSDLLNALNRRIAHGYSQVVSAAISELMFGEPPRQGLYTYARLSVVVAA